MSSKLIVSRYIAEPVTSEYKTFQPHGPLSTAGGGCVCYTSCHAAVCLDSYTGDKAYGIKTSCNQLPLILLQICSWPIRPKSKEMSHMYTRRPSCNWNGTWLNAYRSDTSCGSEIFIHWSSFTCSKISTTSHMTSSWTQLKVTFNMGSCVPSPTEEWRICTTERRKKHLYTSIKPGQNHIESQRKFKNIALLWRGQMGSDSKLN